MAFAENISQYFREEDFAITAKINSIDVVGIFDDGYIEVDGFNSKLESASYIFVCESESLPMISHGATAIIDGVTYKVRGIKPDGIGVTTLTLEKQ